ncbi:hypothetical protein [Streptomyces sp. TRM75563]|uniref:hypothetical protein n=1 Tax=Streptomyces sp. TRM75563 TaxID=2817418 RepID=UPI001F6218CE|nr:hypothetical protein [Streptomyces sp. TRM75563]MCI4040502.1 hypothetical protein [Streptomyces sp. TRM75563]
MAAVLPHACLVARHTEVRRSSVLCTVYEARRSRRLQLACHLHDFVVPDVSGIVAPARATQVVGTDRPEQVLPPLQQIEASGLRVLGSMDRTVHILRSSDGTDPGGRADVRLDLDRSPGFAGTGRLHVLGTHKGRDTTRTGILATRR